MSQWMLSGQKLAPVLSLDDFIAPWAAGRRMLRSRPAQDICIPLAAPASFAIFPWSTRLWINGTVIKYIVATVNAHVLGQGLYVAIPARIG